MIEPSKAPLPVVLRRLALWTVVCGVSAAPSFVWAHQDFDRAAMGTGVGLFIALYTAFTSTARFERFHNRPFVRRTLYIGYGVRLGISVLFPIGMGADMMPGLLSVGVVENVLGMHSKGFFGTFATTCVQGTLLNILLGIVMVGIWGIQKLACKPVDSHGFPVVVRAIRVEQSTAPHAPVP